MKILTVSDEECKALWDYYTPHKLDDYDLIISCGDLKSSYLEFLVTMAHCPLIYVHGNHDGHYLTQPPEGCDCIDGGIIEFNGVRIAGLGGCLRYNLGRHQYTEKQMRSRIRKLWWKLRGGVDILVTHAPAEGYGDDDDPAHQGFACLVDFMDKYRPKYLLHGHVHMCYGAHKERILHYGDTTIINVGERYILEIPDREIPENKRNKIIWKTKEPNPEKIFL